MSQTRMSLVVAGAVGAFLIAMIGASAHTGGLLSFVGIHQTVTSDDHASGTRTEATEPKESPESTSKPDEPKPTSTSKPTSDVEPDADDMMPTPTSTATSCMDEDCSSGGGGD